MFKLLVLISLVLVVSSQSNRRVSPPRFGNQRQQAPCRAVATLTTGGQGVSGFLNFEQMTSTNKGRSTPPVRITGTIYGLQPGAHGFHIHEFGDLSNGCASTGAHYNPASVTHAGPQDQIRHAGDLGNIVADNNGTAHVDITDNVIRLVGPYSIVARAVMVHAKEDDLGRGTGDQAAESKKTGNAGARVACGIIGIANDK